MLRFFLLSLALTTVKCSYLSLGEVDGLHSLHPKLISQSVGAHEVPTKVIRITKTVAVKVPVPYPVKIPHHIPVPVPVNRPVAIPVPQIVKVPHHVPVEVSKAVPVELHQQVPFVVSRPVPIPHPIQVPHPVHIDRPVYYPVPHGIPYQNFANEHEPEHGSSSSYGSDDHENSAHESRSYTYYTIDSPHRQQHPASEPLDHSRSDRADFHGSQSDFQPSQPDYTQVDH